jgi:hypothetical protein
MFALLFSALLQLFSGCFRALCLFSWLNERRLQEKRPIPKSDAKVSFEVRNTVPDPEFRQEPEF